MDETIRTNRALIATTSDSETRPECETCISHITIPAPEEPEGSYTVTVPTLLGCVIFGGPSMRG
jgi:hypothetical protein